jgi:hypothetical protein
MHHRLHFRSVIAAAIALPLLAPPVQAGWWGFRGHTNDTGGIIAWSPETAGTYREIAAAECARWHKLAVITSVHPVYGDYIGFACVWPRDYDPRKTGWHWPF